MRWMISFFVVMVFFGLWVIRIVGRLLFLVCWKISVFICCWRLVFNFENGLFSSSVWGWVSRVWIKVICVFCLFDKVVGLWFLNLFRLMFDRLCCIMVWCLLFLCVCGMVNFRFWLIDICGNNRLFWNKMLILCLCGGIWVIFCLFSFIIFFVERFVDRKLLMYVSNDDLFDFDGFMSVRILFVLIEVLMFNRLCLFFEMMIFFRCSLLGISYVFFVLL